MAGTITVGGVAAGLLTGAKEIGPLTITGTAILSTIASISLAIGDNTVTVPSTATACIVVVSTANAGTIKVRTVNGDTGMQVAKTGLACVLTFDAANRPTTLYINASASGASCDISFI